VAQIVPHQILIESIKEIVTLEEIWGVEKAFQACFPCCPQCKNSVRKKIAIFFPGLRKKLKKISFEKN